MLTIENLLQVLEGYDDKVEVAIATAEQPCRVITVGKILMEYDIVKDKDRIILVGVAPN